MASLFKISTDTINNSAVVAATSTTQGFLKPRMTSAERGAIDGPVEGLEVYNTTLHAPEYLDENEVWIRMGARVPAGTIVDFAGTSAPAGWLSCSGSSLIRDNYPDLFVAIGTTFGSADATHFNLPDLRAMVALGYKSGDPATPTSSPGIGTSNYGAIGNIGGLISVQLAATESGIAAHTHSHDITATSSTLNLHVDTRTDFYGSLSVNDMENGTGTVTSGITTTPTITTAGSVTGVTGGAAGAASAHENRQPYMVLNKIIKY